MTTIRAIKLIGLIALLAAATIAQKPAGTAPRQEKLLNGLKVLVWNTPATDKVALKLRFHGGASFDPQDREGVMKLLAESLFPNNAAKEFFTDELGGDLEVTCNYDYVQINASARSSELLTMLETISTAIANPTLNKEATAALKAALTAKVLELEKDPAYVADRAVAKRLFGTFPYGRPQMGTAESIQKVDFADLRFAKDRLLTADNATLAVIGNADPALVFRAVRRYFGSWLKADKRIPSTFRQPDPPQAGMPVFDSPVANTSEFRFAARALARNDADFYASKILQKIIENRIRAREGQNVFSRNDQHVLPGSYVFGISGWNVGRITKEGTKMSTPVVADYQALFLKDAVTQEEFDNVNRMWISMIKPENTSELWLDADTFKLGPAGKEFESAQNVKIADVQRVLNRLQKEPFAFVLVFAGENAATSRN